MTPGVAGNHNAPAPVRLGDLGNSAGDAAAEGGNVLGFGPDRVEARAALFAHQLDEALGPVVVDDTEVGGHLLERIELGETVVDDGLEAMVAGDLLAGHAGTAEGAAVDSIDGSRREPFADDARLLAPERREGSIDNFAHGHVGAELLLAVANEEQLGHPFERLDERVPEVDPADPARFRGI